MTKTDEGSETEPDTISTIDEICNHGISGKTVVDIEQLTKVKDMLTVLVGFTEDVASGAEKDPVTRAKQLLELLGLEYD